MLNPIILYLTILFDRLLGEPPEKIHPTVLIGKLILYLERVLPNTEGKHKILDFISGSLLVIVTILIVFIIISFIESLIISLPFYLSIPLYSLILSTTIGYKSLIEFCKAPILKIDDLEEAKKEVRKIVSRDVSNLDRDHVLSAAVESLTENITDSIIAPLFYAILFGLKGAFIYRAVNTIDAMIGYKNKEYFYFGKFGARLDDILNLIPARISCSLLILTSPLYGNFKKALHGLREVNKLESPNSGYTMAIVANALDITLEKINYYKLGSGKITKEKALKAFLAVDLTVIAFLLLYTIIFLAFSFSSSFSYF
ncbi:adenosylcobinamide-phosphate synthase CbiB [Methanocaldococcus infernus]